MALASKFQVWASFNLIWGMYLEHDNAATLAVPTPFSDMFTPIGDANYT